MAESSKDAIEVPYKPNPQAFQYLLGNPYETVSSLDGANPFASIPAASPDRPVEPSSATSFGNSRRRLGEMSMFKVNKEFENF